MIRPAFYRQPKNLGSGRIEQCSSQPMRVKLNRFGTPVMARMFQHRHRRNEGRAAENPEDCVGSTKGGEIPLSYKAIHDPASSAGGDRHRTSIHRPECASGGKA
jgi:hypothetical protein